MSSIYGDSIFESNDMIIDRLLESINNDISLFEDFNILNEDTVVDKLKELWNSFIGKIEKIIKFILDKITEFKSKIQTKIVLSRWEKTFTTHSVPFSVIMPSPEGYDDLMNDILEYYKDIKDTFYDSLRNPDIERPISRFKLDNSEKIYEEYYDKDRKYFDTFSDKLCWKVTFDKNSGFDAILKKMESMIKEHFSNMKKLTDLINKIKKDINDTNNEVRKFTKNSNNFTNTGLESYSFYMRELYTILRIAKDFVSVQEGIMLKPRVVSDKEN